MKKSSSRNWQPRRRLLPGIILGCLAGVLPWHPVQAQAQAQPTVAARSATWQFHIGAGPLDPALAEFGRLTGVLITYDSRLAQDRQTQGLQGEYRLIDGLASLLQGTGLRATPVASGGYLIEPEPAGKGAVLLDSVVVTASVGSPQDEVYRTAGSAAYLSRDDIERFRGTSIGDMFQGVPGVLVGENRNSGGLDVNIRGMQGQGRVPVLVDGARQETTVYRGYSGVSSRSYIDPDLIGGVEISKGPVGGAAGVGATGGVVAMRTINADDIVKEGETWGVRLRSTASGNSSAAPAAGTASGAINLGTYRTGCAVASLCQGEYQMPETFSVADGMDRPGMLDFYSYAVSMATAWRHENFELVAAVSKRRQGNYYAGTKGPVPEVSLSERKLPFYTEVTASYEGATRFYGGERVVNSNNESNSQLLKGKFFLPDDQTFELSYMRYESEYGELMPSQLIWLSQVKQTENSEVTAQTVTGRYRWNPVDNELLDLSANLWFTRTDTFNRNYSADVYGTFVSNPEPERYKRLGGDLGNTMRMHGWGDHKLSYGMSFQLEDINTVADASVANTANGRIGDRQEYSAFLDWDWQPWPQLTLAYGVRYQHARTNDDKLVVPSGSNQCTYDSDGNCTGYVFVPSVFCVDTDGDGACDPIRYKTRNSGTVPTYSITWEPWLNGLQFYARHAEALRMPSLFETTQGWSVQPALDVPLKPEHAVNRELGMNLLTNDVLLRDDRLAAKLAYFRNRTDNYLTRTSPNEWEDGSQIFVMRNINNVKLRGFEATIEYDAGYAYTKLSGTKYNFIEVCHYGSYRRNECNNYGVANSYFNNMIPPKWHASALFGARLFGRKLDLGTRLTFMGKRTPTPAFNDDTARGFLQPVPWHAYTLVDLYATYHYSDSLSVDFNVDNLTDQYYLDPLSLGLVPAPGRTARLGVTLTF